MPLRYIVSKQAEHNGGTARIEMDAGQHHFLICTGCNINQFTPGIAPALAALDAHLDDRKAEH
ncbi:hypothetical protein ACFWM0_24965 [Streptomyces sp. NPDC058405]|uniref:hypothetical protein n=1 Tax=Streptomyces sp. NPDC058405 TaxID=3346482 RepID=UPI00364EB044